MCKIIKSTKRKSKSKRFLCYVQLTYSPISNEQIRNLLPPPPKKKEEIRNKNPPFLRIGKIPSEKWPNYGRIEIGALLQRGMWELVAAFRVSISWRRSWIKLCDEFFETITIGANFGYLNSDFPISSHGGDSFALLHGDLPPLSCKLCNL